MSSFQSNFKQLHAKRYREWLQAAQTWVFGEPGLAEKISPYLIFVHSSEGNPEKHILPLMENVRTYGGFPVQGGGSAVGTYRGAEIWILHQYMGCTAAQLWMECLTNTPVHYLIGLAEMTSYPDDIQVGDVILPTTSARGDIVTEFHAPLELPATGNQDLLRRLDTKLGVSGWPIHKGPIYSGMPGGIGVHNPILREKIWRHMQAGILGNAIETSVTYLEAERLNIKAAEAWAVSDDIAHGVTEAAPNGHERWEHAWSLIARAGLDVLADIADEEGRK
jgi:purine-nucleoside phosphorylase